MIQNNLQIQKLKNMQNKGFIKYLLHEINYVLGTHYLRAPKKMAYYVFELKT